MDIGQNANLPPNWKEWHQANANCQCRWKSSANPAKSVANKIIGFGLITIAYINHNAIAFLRRFHHFFAVSSINLYITTTNAGILEFVLRNILPMLRDAIRYMYLDTIAFHRLRELAPSLLSDYPALRFVSFNDAIPPAFPPDESANASDGHAVAKWLFTPRSDGVSKWLKYDLDSPEDEWSSMMEPFKAAFSNASSPVNFCICFRFPPSPHDLIVPFDLINEVTGEQLLLVQSPNAFFALPFSNCVGWDKLEKGFGRIPCSTEPN